MVRDAKEVRVSCDDVVLGGGVGVAAHGRALRRAVVVDMYCLAEYISVVLVVVVVVLCGRAGAKKSWNMVGTGVCEDEGWPEGKRGLARLVRRPVVG